MQLENAPALVEATNGIAEKNIDAVLVEEKKTAHS